MARRQASFCLALLAVALAPETARATAEFPATIKSYWNTTLPVSGQGCTLCHQTDRGGAVYQPFGHTVQNHGARKNDAGSLKSALDYVRTHATDSDGDTVSDYDELVRDHTNPNDRRSVKLPQEPEPMPDETAGAGGQGDGSGGGAGELNAGGGASEPLPRTDYYPPASEPLPPPFRHGCALSPRHGAPSESALPWVALALCALRLARRSHQNSSRI